MTQPDTPAPCDHEKLLAEVERLRCEISRLSGRQTIPLIDQNGNKVGIEYLSFKELHEHHVYVDADGKTWMRPTAWAWAMRCKSANAADEELRATRAKISELSRRPEPAADADEEEAYKIGVDEGRQEMAREIDLATGGDGEFRYCMNSPGDERHCPDEEAMKARIIERFRDRRPAADAAKCPASPDHADVLATIADAPDDWQSKGYATALAEVRDMANVGRALMEALPDGYHYNDCPSEIVSDLQNQIADLQLFPAADAVEAVAKSLYEASCANDPVEPKQPDWGRGGYKTEVMYWQALARAAIAAMPGVGERAAIVDWLSRDAAMCADELRKLHQGKKLTPMMTAEWEAMIAAKSGVAAAIQRGEHLRTPAPKGE